MKTAFCDDPTAPTTENLAASAQHACSLVRLHMLCCQEQNLSNFYLMVNFYVGTIEHFYPYKPWLKPKPSLAEL
jgi:hypothetical protein